VIAAKTILKYLPTYNGDHKLLIENQSVDDIIGAMRKFHRQYATDYDRIYKFFVGNTPERTAQKLFNFIKDNCSYYVEGIESQTVRNPSAIMATGKLDGIDCKNMSLFIGGILSAINRSGEQNIPYSYRFAQTDQYDENYNHVFIVINPKTQRELFIDPIPEVKQLDDRFPIYSYTDKNFENMSLIGIGGVTVADYTAYATTGAAAAAQGGLNPIADIAALIAAVKLITKLFPGHSNWWIMDNAYRTGDYEKAAIMMIAFYNNAAYNTHPEQGAGFMGDLAVRERQLWIPIIYANTKSPNILAIWKAAVDQGILPATGLPATTTNPIFANQTYQPNVVFPSGNIPITPGANTTTQSNLNMYLTIALVGGGIYLITRKSK
jgi:hypothetical protein